jgi:hypothetical protein
VLGWGTPSAALGSKPPLHEDLGQALVSKGVRACGRVGVNTQRRQPEPCRPHGRLDPLGTKWLDLLTGTSLGGGRFTGGEDGAL